MIDLNDICKNIEKNKGSIIDLEFNCERCDQKHSLESLRISMLLYGISFLVNNVFEIVVTISKFLSILVFILVIYI